MSDKSKIDAGVVVEDEKSEAQMLILAMLFFNRYRGLLNFELAQMFAQDAQDFFNGKLEL